MNRSTSSLSDSMLKKMKSIRSWSDESIGFGTSRNSLNSDFTVNSERTNQRFLKGVLSKDDKLKLLNSVKNIGGMVRDTRSRLNRKRAKQSNHCAGDSYLLAGNYELAKKFYMLALQSEISNSNDDNTVCIANLMSGIGISTSILGNSYVGLAWLTDAKNVILEKNNIECDDWIEIANIFEDMAFVSFIGFHNKTDACQYVIEAIRIRRLLDNDTQEEYDDNDDPFLTKDDNHYDPSIQRLQYMMEIIVENKKREIDIVEVIKSSTTALGVKYPKILHMLSFLGNMHRNEPLNNSILSLLYFEEALKLIRAANVLEHPCSKDVFKNILEIENNGCVMRFKPRYVKHAT